MRMKITMSSPQIMFEKDELEKDFKHGRVSNMQYSWKSQELKDREQELVNIDDAYPIQGWIKHNMTDNTHYVVMSTKDAKMLRHDAMMVLTRHVAPGFLFPAEPGICDERAGIIPVIVGLTNALKSLTDTDKEHLFIYSEG